MAFDPVDSRGGVQFSRLSCVPEGLKDLAFDAFIGGHSGMLTFVPEIHAVDDSDSLIVGMMKVDDLMPPLPESRRGDPARYVLSTVELSPEGVQVGVHYGEGQCTERCVGYLLTTTTVQDTNPRRGVFLGGRPDPFDQFAACVAHASGVIDELLSTSVTHDPHHYRAGAGSGYWPEYFSRHNLGRAASWLLGLPDVAQVAPIAQMPPDLAAAA